MVLQFKIQIKGITKPPVWRKVAVPANFTFLKFHQTIQTIFGWEDYHMFEFRDKEYHGNVRISLPLDDDFLDFAFFPKAIDASKLKLSEVFTTSGQKLLYIYDFGDNWLHEITLEVVTDDKQKKAVCLLGKGACPPEDCGGIWGYEDIKEALGTLSDSEQANELREWLELDEGEVWDANAFNIEEINADLKQI